MSISGTSSPLSAKDSQVCAVATWVVNQVEDQEYLDFMNVDPEDLIQRKGLFESNFLHKRRDKRLTLLHNGRKRPVGSGDAAIVKSMGTFSWFMTLCTSAIDAALGLSDTRRTMSSFLTALVKDQTDGTDYLQRELPQHIQGWMSTAIFKT